MLLPSETGLYDALIARDPGYDGRVYVGVTTTGVFCRLTCPARKPKRENCRFFDSVGAVMEAGFRPCKRCHPLLGNEAMEPMVRALLEGLEDDPQYRWSEPELSRRGYDPSTVRRAFQRQFGMTFLAMARQRRLASGFSSLSQGNPVIDAQLDAGYESPSAFRTAFARLLGQAPGSFRKDALLKADWIDTPLGAMIAVADKRSLHLLEFADRKALPAELRRLFKATKGSIGFGRTEATERTAQQLSEFFAGTRPAFDVPLTYHGSEFTRSVWDALRRIPAGHTRSYSDLATSLERPSATRAVARANGANQIAILIPCHRVLGADGSLTGYGGGLWRKRRLIEIERHYAEGEMR